MFKMSKIASHAFTAVTHHHHQVKGFRVTTLSPVVTPVACAMLRIYGTRSSRSPDRHEFPPAAAGPPVQLSLASPFFGTFGPFRGVMSTTVTDDSFFRNRVPVEISGVTVTVTVMTVAVTCDFESCPPRCYNFAAADALFPGASTLFEPTTLREGISWQGGGG